MGRMSNDSAPPRRRKTCGFCADKVEFIDYKDPNRLQNFATPNQRQLR